MKKEYRNAIRSRSLIKQAFIELLNEKDLAHITVVDVVNRADLSRNTFYTHYQDIYAVLEEYQYESLAELDHLLRGAVSGVETDRLLHLLHTVSGYAQSHQDAFRMFLRSKAYDSFVKKLKQILIERLVDQIDVVVIKDPFGFQTFLEVIASGFIDLLVRFLRNETDLRLSDIEMEVSRIFSGSLHLYQ